MEAPIDGRVQYRLAEPGEVLPAGGKVVTLLDLTEVYMKIFLPTNQAGRVAIGADARIILDAAPQYVIPASVSFVASEAQFTPREAETPSERDKLMFRTKVRIDPDLLQVYIDQVKTGLPGEAFVMLGAGGEGRTNSPFACRRHPGHAAFVARLQAVGHRHGKTIALYGIMIDLPAGTMVGLVGPDGVGKSTLLGLVAGARRIQTGSVEALGGDMSSKAHRKAPARISTWT